MMDLFKRKNFSIIPVFTEFTYCQPLVVCDFNYHNIKIGSQDRIRTDTVHFLRVLPPAVGLLGHSVIPSI